MAGGVGVNDSKKLTRARRQALFDIILATCETGLGVASVEEIDQINILQASLLAMRRAVLALQSRPDLALVDGRQIPAALPCAAEAVIRGDARSLSIAAASILAKVTRDRIMAELAELHPEYGWERNAGYGVEAHRVALLQHGVTPHHRRSFKPIHKMLY
jgi:ribonuclease HII